MRRFAESYELLEYYTDKAWQQAWRARRLRESLAKGESVTTSILNAGFPDSSSYYRKADETLGMTAKQFRHGGENLAVRYALATARTAFGLPMAFASC